MLEKMRETTIGIIIPVYNVEKWIRQCLNSVFEQTQPFDEVVIIDDGSIDNSSVIAKEFSDRYENTILIHQDNAGLGAARNKGLDIISSDYFMFLDSDDYIDKRTVEILKSIVTSNPIDSIYYNGQCFFDTINPADCCDRDWIRSDSLMGYIMSGKELFVRSYPDNYLTSVCLNLFKRETVNKIKFRFNEGNYYEDNFFCFCYLDKAEKVMCIPEILYMRRLREGSITTSPMSIKKLHDLSREYRDICIYIRENMSENTKTAWFSYLQDQMLLILDYIFANDYEKEVKNDEILMRLFDEYKYIRDIYKYDFIRFGLYKKNHKIVCGLKKCFGSNYQQYHISLLEPRQEKKEFYKYYKRIYKSLLFEIPGKRIGIYGAGKHTAGLLELYYLFFNERPVADIRIIQTNKTLDNFMGYAVDSIDEINTFSFDAIIISSYFFRNEMKKTLEDQKIRTKIIDIYDKVITDIFSEYEIVKELFSEN